MYMIECGTLNECLPTRTACSWEKENLHSQTLEKSWAWVRVDSGTQGQLPYGCVHVLQQYFSNALTARGRATTNNSCMTQYVRVQLLDTLADTSHRDGGIDYFRMFT